jgi:hypothetical protein
MPYAKNAICQTQQHLANLVNVLFYNLWHTDVQVNLTRQQQIVYNLWQTEI